MPQARGNWFGEYRTIDGNACLIGVSIKDSELSVPSVMYNESASEVARDLGWEPCYLSDPYRISYEPYRYLQRCHDELNPEEYSEKIEQSLRKFAEKFGLAIPGE
jgi:hypothetical protein